MLRSKDSYSRPIAARVGTSISTTVSQAARRSCTRAVRVCWPLMRKRSPADAGAVNLGALPPVAGPHQMAEKAHMMLAERALALVGRSPGAPAPSPA